MLAAGSVLHAVQPRAHTHTHSRTRHRVTLLCFSLFLPLGLSLSASIFLSDADASNSDSNSNEQTEITDSARVLYISVRWKSTFSSSLDFHSVSRVSFSLRACVSMFVFITREYRISINRTTRSNDIVYVCVFVNKSETNFM